ncbi:hypothetical protein RCL1_004204 [Eukaryota sp. TZLM3-RCL]
MATTSIVRFTHQKVTFEIITKPGSILEYRKGNGSLENCLVADVVFKNATKGDRASDAELLAAFNTTNQQEAIQQIAEKGEVQLTAAERRTYVEQKRRQMIAYVHKNFISPQTNLPHPITRIEAAFDQIHLRIDPFVPAQKQVEDQVLKPIVSIIPLKKSEIVGVVKMPHHHVGRCMAIVHKYATVRKENYTSEGAELDVSVSPGDFDALNADLSNASKGEATFNLSGSTRQEQPPVSEKKGKKRR